MKQENGCCPRCFQVWYESMLKWLKKNWKTLFGGIGTAIVTLIIGVVIGRYFPNRDNTNSTSNENTNSGQQQPVFNQGDINQQTNIQNQSIPPQELMKELKDSGKTEYKLEISEQERERDRKELELLKNEDKDIRDSLIRAENNEKYDLTAVIWHEYIERHITKDEALKFTDMVNKAYWKDLKSFIAIKILRLMSIIINPSYSPESLK